MAGGGPPYSRFELTRQNISMWLVGIVLAFVLIGYGVYGLVKGTSYMYGRNAVLLLHGSTAQALNLAYITLGLTLNVRYHWSTIKGWESRAGALSTVFLSIFVILLVVVLYRVVSA